MEENKFGGEFSHDQKYKVTFEGAESSDELEEYKQTLKGPSAPLKYNAAYNEEAAQQEVMRQRKELVEKNGIKIPTQQAFEERQQRREEGKAAQEKLNINSSNTATQTINPIEKVRNTILEKFKTSDN